MPNRSNKMNVVDRMNKYVNELNLEILYKNCKHLHRPDLQIGTLSLFFYISLPLSLSIFISFFFRSLNFFNFILSKRFNLFLFLYISCIFFSTSWPTNSNDRTKNEIIKKGENKWFERESLHRKDITIFHTKFFICV